MNSADCMPWLVAVHRKRVKIVQTCSSPKGSLAFRHVDCAAALPARLVDRACSVRLVDGATAAQSSGLIDCAATFSAGLVDRAAALPKGLVDRASTLTSGLINGAASIFGLVNRASALTMRLVNRTAGTFRLVDGAATRAPG